MISVQEAEKNILDHVRVFPEECRALKDSYGFVLREDIFADRDQPPTDRVSMDGIVIDFSSWEKGERSFQIQETMAAGSPIGKLKSPKHCIEIMTGAPLPQGCDCMIPVEDIIVDQGRATVKDDVQPERMQNIRRQGSVYKKGELLLKSGTILGPQQIAVAASVGKAFLKVTISPKIAVIGTGDELVDIDQPVEVHQSRRSNAYMVQAALQLAGFPHVEIFHLADDISKLLVALKEILQRFDVIILSGGVSMGKFDYVPQVLQELGVKVLFHKVKQRPGKPFWFGQSSLGKPVFALPGNPASTEVCIYRYALPYLRRAAGLELKPSERVILSQEYKKAKNFTHFYPVSVRDNSEGKRVATLIGYTDSGDYAALSESDGFVEFPEGEESFGKGDVLPYWRWKN
ncbi:MAG: molybdopterin molybdotransferase MoeA [Candidatus Omnitrophica bacterium]|nr:molybdopterin molybdotransferase MoeA [Candidatus Omnitrophota bacterium]